MRKTFEEIVYNFILRSQFFCPINALKEDNNSHLVRKE